MMNIITFRKRNSTVKGINGELINAAINNHFRNLKTQHKNLRCDNEGHQTNGYITVLSKNNKEVNIQFDHFCCEEFESKCVNLMR
jgi:hypothetical protein